MNRYPNSNAVVLWVDETKEKDLEAILLHEQLGKRRLNAKGGRASQKGVAAALQAGNVIQCQVYRGRSHDTLQQVDILESPLHHLTSPEQLHCLHYFLWLIQTWCEWDTPVPELYALLRLALQTLLDFDPEQLPRIKRRFELALLRAEGLAVATDQEFARIFFEHTNVSIPERFIQLSR